MLLFTDNSPPPLPSSLVRHNRLPLAPPLTLPPATVPTVPPLAEVVFRESVECYTGNAVGPASKMTNL